MLDKILPIHGKCLYLQYANNLIIMNTQQILDCLKCAIREKKTPLILDRYEEGRNAGLEIAIQLIERWEAKS